MQPLVSLRQQLGPGRAGLGGCLGFKMLLAWGGGVGGGILYKLAFAII